MLYEVITEGGFTSALDADSEGEEGRFYRWEREEIRALLTPEEYAVVTHRFDLDSTPNFEGHWYPTRPLERARSPAWAILRPVGPEPEPTS